MVANWQEYRDLAVAGVDPVHGEHVRIEPMLSGSQYGHGTPDPSRIAFECVAPLRIVGGQQSMAGENKRAGWNGSISTGTSELHLDPGAVPPGLVLRTGDIVVALDRGGARYEMQPFEPRSLSRWVIPIVLRYGNAQSSGA